MVRVVIYGEHKEETEGLEGMLRAILTEKQRWPGHPYLYWEFGKLSAFCSGKSISDHASFRDGKERGTDRSEDPGK